MLAKRKVDATQGPLVSLIFTFAIPLILTTLVQDLFNIADKAVLGNMAGSVAVAAIGATGSITGLIINGAVAIATITSKIISSVLVARRLMRFEDSARVVVKNMRFQWSAFTQIFRFGVPVSISNMVLPLANLQIVSAVNSYGVDAIAGNSAAGSVHTVVTAFSTGFGAATATFMGQNIGARNVDRVKKSFRYSFWINVLITGSLGLVMCLTGEFWLKLILGADEVAAIHYGMIRMWLVTLFMFVHAANKCFTSGLQAFGYPFLTSVTNVVFTLGFRVLWMQVIYPHHPTFDMVMLCFSVAWIINMLFYGGFFLAIYRRYVKKGICKKI